MLTKSVLVIAAHPKEAKALRNKSLESNVELNVCGVGRQAKKFLTNTLQNSLTPPSFILNIGFAGALSKEVGLGEVILSNEFLKLANDTSYRLKIDQNQPQVAKVQDFFKTVSRSCRQGAILTMDKPITNAFCRDKLFDITGALAVDMESYYLAEAAIEHALSSGKDSILFLSLKIISDQADKDTRKMVKLKSSEFSEKLAYVTYNLLKVL